MPVKFDWIEISRVERSDCTSSRGTGAAGAASAARTGAGAVRAAGRRGERGSHPRARHERSEAEELGRLQHEIEQQTKGDGEHHHREHRPELLASQSLAGTDPELAADDAAGRQDQRQHDVERLVELACRMVTTAVTKMIWNIEVPITILVGMRNR